jgi:Zn-dependent protease with chaperone function
MLRLFSTHPPTEERIARLSALARRRLGLSA